MNIIDGIKFCEEESKKLFKAADYIRGECGKIKLKGLAINAEQFMRDDDGFVSDYSGPVVTFEGDSIIELKDCTDKKRMTSRIMFKVASRLADEEQACDLYEDIEAIHGFVSGEGDKNV